MEIIDICGGDALCMETADWRVTIHIETSGKATERELKLCERHLDVMRRHAADRCKSDPTLTIRFEVRAAR